MRAPLFLGCLLFVVLLGCTPAAAEAKSYHYQSINARIAINKDSTFDVEEIQTFVFQGNFHAATRDIPLDKISGITNIEVVDAATGVPLQHGSRQPGDITPADEGRYADWVSDGVQHIEWYFNLADTTHAWTIRYKVHGGIEFDRASDRLYWNVLTNYTVPIDSSEVHVVLPWAINQSDAQLAAYRTYVNNPIISSFSTDTFSFKAEQLAPGEAFTIDTGWPKGIVDQNAFWSDFIMLYYGYFGGGLFAFLGLCICLGWWFFKEKLPRLREIIVPEYTPPENLRPAIAEVVIKEKVTEKGLAATMIDLAVRGYVSIEEEKIRFEDYLPLVILVIVFSGFVALFYYTFLPLEILPVLLLVLVIRGGSKWIMIAISQRKHYTLRRIKKPEGDDPLKTYEQEYLGMLFKGKEVVSTRDFRKDRTLGQEIVGLKKNIYKEVDAETHAFEVTVSSEQKMKGLMTLLIVGVVIATAYFSELLSQESILLGSFLLIGVITWAFIRYEARLSKEGEVLAKDWLGFKMYLEVAERYRMQNLTPDLFEKYLPYAMIFGVEKKWARAFEGMQMSPPSWYVASGVVGGSSISGGAAPAFSPSAFSAGFASSFSSSFGSGGGSGGGVGGGGAGGGGGGGGGGAR